MDWSNRNLTKLPIGSWRSIHGYGAAHIAYGRLLLSGYNFTLSLWRDSKFDAILDYKGTSFRLELKSTGIFENTENKKRGMIGFTSGGRAGQQIRRSVASREKIIEKENTDFGIGVNSHTGHLWIIPVEVLTILKKKQMPFNAIAIFKEKLGVFKGVTINNNKISPSSLKRGFLDLSTKECRKLCSKIGIRTNSNINPSSLIKHNWTGITVKNPAVTVTGHESMVLDIWKKIYSAVK